MELFEKVQGVSSHMVELVMLDIKNQGCQLTLPLFPVPSSLFRVFPLDMAGFAVHLCQLFKNPKARVGVDIHGHTSRNGFLETDFLQHFATKSTVECRGSETEVRVYIIRKSFRRAQNFLYGAWCKSLETLMGGSTQGHCQSKCPFREVSFIQRVLFRRVAIYTCMLHNSYWVLFTGTLSEQVSFLDRCPLFWGSFCRGL